MSMVIVCPFRQSALHAFSRKPIYKMAFTYEEGFVASRTQEIRYSKIYVSIDDEPTWHDVVDVCFNAKDSKQDRAYREKNK